MSLQQLEICPLKQAFLEAQKSCHWACKSVTERQFPESVFPKPEKGKLRDTGCDSLAKGEIFQQPQPLAWADPVLLPARCPVEDSRATVRPQKLSPQLLLIHGPAVACCAGLGRK